MGPIRAMADPVTPAETDWRAFFAARHDDLSALRVARVRDDVIAALAAGGPAALASLKRHVRELGRDAGAGGAAGQPDPLLVEAALRAAGADVRGLGGAALRDARLSDRGLDEPVLEMRAIEIARRLFARVAEAPVDAAALDLADVTGVPAGKIVVWYLTGLDMPAPSDGEAWNVAGAASTVDDVLSPLGLLSPATTEARRARIRAWSAAATRAREMSGRGRDPIEARFWELWGEREGDLRAARHALAGALRGGESSARAEGAALGLLARLAGDDDRWPAGAGALAAFCGCAQVVGLVAALPRRDHRLAAYGGSFAARLVARLPEVLAGQPVSLLGAQVGFVFWRSIVLLAGERVRRDMAADLAKLLNAAAETGALTRAIADQVARVVDVVEGGPGEGLAERRALATGFLARLSFAASRRRGLAAERMFRDGVRRVVDLSNGAAAEQVRRLWQPAPSGTEPPAVDLLEVVRLCAGSSVPEGAPPRELARFWRGAAAHLASDAPDAPLVARVHAMLDRAIAETEAGGGGGPRSTSTAAPGASKVGGRTSLAIQELEGRHGELYLLVRLFAAGEHGVTALLEEEHYPRPADAAEEMEALQAALSDLRERAASGIAVRADVDAVAAAIAALAPRRLWAQLAEHVAGSDAAVEIAAASFGIPWELAPLARDGGDVPLGLGVAALRRRGGSAAIRRGAVGPVRSMLLFCDPEQPGALEETAAIQRLFREGGRSIRTIASVDAFRALPEGARFDAVHYAGHQGPGSDATPALALGDGRLPLRQLLDRFHDAPPQLLFLNACSTLRPSEQIATGDRRGSTHLVFGPLEALLRSSIPCFAGTLWDISPPPEPAFVRAFYEAVTRGESPAAAMLAARRAVSDSPAWAACWPAYVIVAP